jgi:hypothetical protein
MEEAQEEELVTPTAKQDEKTTTGADAREASHDWVQRLVADATDADGNVDDTKLLELIKEHLDICEDHRAAVRSVRAQAIVRERERGKSNVELTESAGLSDSGVARAAIGAGGKRRFTRRSGPSDRRTADTDRRSSGSP